MSPQQAFRKSARLVQMIGNLSHVGFGHHVRRASDLSGSESESEPLCHSGGSSPDSKLGLNNDEIVLKARSVGGCNLPKDIHHGNMAVYVGRDRKRYVIKTHYLTHHLFKALLKRSEEEFEFCYEGGLPIMCEPVLFEHLMWLIATGDPAGKTGDLDLGDLLEFYDV